MVTAAIPAVSKKQLAGKTLASFLDDEMLQDAVERNLEIIGEASRQMSDSFRANHSEIPWSDIIGMRNVLAHGYAQVNPSRVWSTVREYVPELLAAVRRIEQSA